MKEWKCGLNRGWQRVGLTGIMLTVIGYASIDSRQTRASQYSEVTSQTLTLAVTGTVKGPIVEWLPIEAEPDSRVLGLLKIKIPDARPNTAYTIAITGPDILDGDGRMKFHGPILDFDRISQDNKSMHWAKDGSMKSGPVYYLNSSVGYEDLNMSLTKGNEDQMPPGTYTSTINVQYIID